MGSWKKSGSGTSVEQSGVSVQSLAKQIHFSLDGEVILLSFHLNSVSEGLSLRFFFFLIYVFNG